MSCNYFDIELKIKEKNLFGNIKRIICTNKNIFVNIMGAFFVKGGSVVLSLFLLPAYIRFFGNQNILGTWYTILSILSWVLWFDLGIGNGLRNKLPEALEKNDRILAKKLVSSTYISTLSFVIVIVVAGALIINYLNWNSLLNVSETDLSPSTLKLAIQIAFCGIVIQFLLKLVTSILYAIQKSAIVNLLALFSNIIIFFIISILPNGNEEKSIIIISFVNIIAVNLPLIIASVILFSGKLRDVRPSFGYFDKSITKSVFQVGLTLLWLQLIFMVVSSTNEFLISALCLPSDVVEYQVYFKIFNSVAAVFSLSLIPIWSATTKAQVEKKYTWIKKTYTFLLCISFVILFLELIVAFFMQPIVDYWLKDESIPIIFAYSVIFAFSSFIFIIHNVNTSIGNGVSFFKPQMVLMTLAAVIDLPLAWLLVKLTGGWIGVILANIIALLPFEILEPVFFFKYINRLISNESRE